MKRGDKVKMAPMWKLEEATGEIIKITADGYVVVKWEEVNGEWHYTKKQAKRLQAID